MLGKYNVNGNQKELLRKIIKEDDDGLLHRKGYVFAIRGDDEYQLEESSEEIFIPLLGIHIMK